MVTTLNAYRYDAEAERDHIGQKIKSIRQKRRLSQRQLALYAGVSPSYIAYIERGNRSPSLTTLKRIAHCLGVAPETFFQEEQTDARADGENKLAELFSYLKPEEIEFVEKVVEAYLQLRRR